MIWRCCEKKCGSHLLWVVNSILPIITFHHYLLIVTSITLSVCQVSTEELGRNHVLDQVTNTTLSIWSANSNMSHSIVTQAQPGSPFISPLSCNKANNTFGSHNRAVLFLLQFSDLDPILHRNQLLYYSHRILFSNTRVTVIHRYTSRPFFTTTIRRNLLLRHRFWKKDWTKANIPCEKGENK